MDSGAIIQVLEKRSTPSGDLRPFPPKIDTQWASLDGAFLTRYTLR